MIRLFLASAVVLSLLSWCVAGYAQQAAQIQIHRSSDQDQEEGAIAPQGTMVFATGDGGEGMSVFSVGGFHEAPLLAGGLPGLPAPDLFSLAQNGSVQKEIELVDEQLDQLKEINAEFSRKMKDQFEAFRQGDSFDPGKARNLGDLLKKLKQEKQTQMEQVLLPHQIDRLRQIALQTHMKRSGETAMLASQQVMEALDLTEDQMEKLQEKSKQLKKEMQEEIEKMKEKAREELFEELTREQREKLESMLGESFEMKRPKPNGRIFRKNKDESR